MTKERLAKAKATKEAKRQGFDQQTIRINQDWKIIRFDELNWQVQFKGKSKGHYYRLPDAFQSLPATMLGEEAKNSLADCQRMLLAIREDVNKAMQVARLI